MTRARKEMVIHAGKFDCPIKELVGHVNLATIREMNWKSYQLANAV